MNVATGALRTGTDSGNVRYKWIIGGVSGGVSTDGITQPDPSFSLFRIAATPPAGAEELIIYDATDDSNWNTIPVL